MVNIVFFVIILACRDTQKIPSEEVVFEEVVHIDSDGDGYLSDEDCDDTSATTHPNSVELCDGIDNNCDKDGPK